MKHAASCAAKSLLALSLVAAALSFSGASASSLGDSVQPLYIATESFLDLVQPADKSFLLKEVVPKIINGSFLNDWRAVDISQKSREYVQSMLGYAILVGLGVALIILVPLTGCCVCCCRSCCNKCGGRLSKMEHKGAKCRRTVYGMFFLVFVTFVLFGAVLALVSNQLLRQQFPRSSQDGSSAGAGALDAVSSSLASLVDTVTSLPARGREATPRIVSLVVTQVKPSLSDSLTAFQAILINTTDAGGVIEAARSAIDKLAVSQNLTLACADGHTTLQDSVNALNETLTRLRGAAKPCPDGASELDCNIVNNSTSFNEKLPGASELAEVKDLLNKQSAADLGLRLDKAWSGMTNITKAGMEMVDKYLTDAQNSLNRSELMKVWDRLNSSLTNELRDIGRYRNISQLVVVNPFTRASSSLGDMVSEFDSYRYYAYLGMGCLVLLFVALFYLGLVYGCAGGPPHEDAGCCNRGVGATCLLAGAGLTFLFYALLMVIVMLFFLSGGLFHTETCRYLRDRPGTGGYRLLDDIVVQALRRAAGSGGVTIGNVSLDLTRPVSNLLSGCSPNGSLSSVLDVGQLLSGLGVPSTIDGFLNNAQTELVKRAADFVPQDAFNSTQLRDLLTYAGNASSFNVTSYKLQMSLVMSSPLLTSLSAALLNISKSANASSERSRFAGYYGNLTQAVAAVNASQLAQAARADQLFSALSALTGSLAGLPDRLASVGTQLRSPNVLRGAFNASTAGLSPELQGLAVWALGQLLTDTVDCAGMGRQLRQLIDVPCVRILQPFNGFWSGIGVCLLGLLPCLLLAIKLANLYRKKLKYQPNMDDRLRQLVGARPFVNPERSSAESKL